MTSGEIIFAIDPISIFNSEENSSMVQEFFKKHEIKVENEALRLKEISIDKAIQSIRYGLSTKANYTLIDKEFTKIEMDKLIGQLFSGLFHFPRCYTMQDKIFQSSLDLHDFWETGGAILIDKNSIGIFWINDLYNKF